MTLFSRQLIDLPLALPEELVTANQVRRAFFRKLRGPGYCRPCSGVGSLQEIEVYQDCYADTLEYRPRHKPCLYCGGRGLS